MKTIIIITSLLLLTSCTQYRYDVQYEKCSGQTGSLSYTGIGGNSPMYSWQYRRLLLDGERISNICDYSYKKTEL